MIDYERVYFNEKDEDDIPIQYFFTYDLNDGELDKFLALTILMKMKFQVISK